jgi:hypothetical protein
MAKKPKQKTSEKLKEMSDQLRRMEARRIQPQQPAQPQQTAPPAQPAQTIQPAPPPQQKPVQKTFRYHERPKNYTKPFLVRMTDDAYVKLNRASYVTGRDVTDIAREGINRYLAELEADHGKPFPPHPTKEK